MLRSIPAPVGQPRTRLWLAQGAFSSCPECPSAALIVHTRHLHIVEYRVTRDDLHLPLKPGPHLHRVYARAVVVENVADVRLQGELVVDDLTPSSLAKSSLVHLRRCGRLRLPPLKLPLCIPKLCSGLSANCSPATCWSLPRALSISTIHH